jgi:hypothetical protein
MQRSDFEPVRRRLFNCARRVRFAKVPTFHAIREMASASDLSTDRDGVDILNPDEGGLGRASRSITIFAFLADCHAL